VGLSRGFGPGLLSSFHVGSCSFKRGVFGCSAAHKLAEPIVLDSRRNNRPELNGALSEKCYSGAAIRRLVVTELCRVPQIDHSIMD
jgi:hypothetical protein